MFLKSNNHKNIRSATTHWKSTPNDSIHSMHLKKLPQCSVSLSPKKDQSKIVYKDVSRTKIPQEISRNDGTQSVKATRLITKTFKQGEQVRQGVMVHPNEMLAKKGQKNRYCTLSERKDTFRSAPTFFLRMAKKAKDFARLPFVLKHKKLHHNQSIPDEIFVIHPKSHAKPIYDKCHDHRSLTKGVEKPFEKRRKAKVSKKPTTIGQPVGNDDETSKTTSSRGWQCASLDENILDTRSQELKDSQRIIDQRNERNLDNRSLDNKESSIQNSLHSMLSVMTSINQHSTASVVAHRSLSPTSSGRWHVENLRTSHSKDHKRQRDVSSVTSHYSAGSKSIHSGSNEDKTKISRKSKSRKGKDDKSIKSHQSEGSHSIASRRDSDTTARKSNVSPSRYQSSDDGKFRKSLDSKITSRRITDSSTSSNSSRSGSSKHKKKASLSSETGELTTRTRTSLERKPRKKRDPPGIKMGDDDDYDSSEHYDKYLLVGRARRKSINIL